MEGTAEGETATRFMMELEDKWPSKQAFRAVFRDMNIEDLKREWGMSSLSSGPPSPIPTGGGEEQAENLDTDN